MNCWPRSRRWTFWLLPKRWFAFADFANCRPWREQNDWQCLASLRPEAAEWCGVLCGFVLDCASASVAVPHPIVANSNFAVGTLEWPDWSRVNHVDAGQAAFRRAKPSGGGNRARGDRASPHLPAVARQAGEAQPFDPRESAGRPASVHACNDGAAGAGAWRLLAQGIGWPARAATRQWRYRAGQPRRLFAPRGVLAGG